MVRTGHHFGLKLIWVENFRPSLTLKYSIVCLENIVDATTLTDLEKRGTQEPSSSEILTFGGKFGGSL